MHGRDLTFDQGMDAQPDRREISLPNLPTQLVEANPPPKHQLVGDPLVVGHVIDESLKGRLLHPLLFTHLWDGRYCLGDRGLG